MAETPKTLQERQNDKATAKTVWDTPKKDWEYITVPEENALGERHSNMGLNQYTFEAGRTYHVPPAIAVTLKERLREYARACVRVLQPKRDVTSENQVAMGTLGPNRGAVAPIDPGTINTD